ncbi:AraC family transcriptional regulator [Chryseobacterium bernardetii]|uniref:AraC family transcriptional regulator n=1 Tax=Chryseobacterium bernardetii TaxID=1241978 RepID=UPI001627CB72|nr:AraC family transcriptional regulator [Chryseobacterium bernardetii]
MNDNEKARYVIGIEAETYVWYEKDWQYDNKEHTHEHYQLTYVEEGYQYVHIERKVFLIPQNYVVWIPKGKRHYTTSNAKFVNLMLAFFKTVPEFEFYHEVHVFPAPLVLKEMLLYAMKWNALKDEDSEQKVFLHSFLNSLPNFCENKDFLHLPVPNDERLLVVCSYINDNYFNHLSIEELADIALMSGRSLQRIFKMDIGITIKKYIQLVRILKSIELIDKKQYTLSQIAYKVGYKSLSAFTSSYLAVMKSPAKLKK